MGFADQCGTLCPWQENQAQCSELSMGSDLWHEIMSEPSTGPLTPWTLSQMDNSASSPKKDPSPI